MAKILFFRSLSVLAFILLYLGLNSLSAQADDLPTRAHQHLDPTTYLPLKRDHRVAGQPVIQTLLNGKEPAAFLVDTGATLCVLSPEMAKRLNLERRPAVLDDGTPFLYQKKQPSEVTLSSFKFGDYTIHINGGSFILLNDQNFMGFPNRNSDDTLFDGILGTNLLNNYAVLLDASQHLLGLCSPGNLSLSQVGQVGYTAPYLVPIFQKDGFWFVTVWLTNNGISQSEDMVLDTGSNITTISDTAAAHLGLTITEEQRMTDVYSNNVPIGAASVDTLQIGGVVLHGHAIKVATISKLEPPRLGMDILSGYRVLMDFPAKKMYLQSNTATAAPKITVGPQTPGVRSGR